MWRSGPKVYIQLIIPKLSIITGSIARSASRRYLIYSDADVEVFRPAGATRCIHGNEIWCGWGDRRSPLPRQISPYLCLDKGVRPQKLKFLLRFDQNVEYKRPAGAYPLRDFHKICRFCTPFHALGVKTWLGLLKRLWSYGVLSWGGLVSPKFSAMRHTQTF